MDILDQPNAMKRFDQGNMLGSVESLGKQCQHAWSDTKKIKIPRHYSQAKNIAVFGMGGSALGAHIMKTVFGDRLRVPFEIINDYNIPAWVDHDTFVILSSYSGSTEETVTVAEAIHRRTKKIAVVATSGRLYQLALKRGWPMYVIKPTFNPSGQPRMAVGYSVVGQLGIMKATGLLKISETELKKAFQTVTRHSKLLAVNRRNNPAKKLARSLQGKAVLLMGSEFLLGNLHTFSNQLNESAKNFATYFPIPEVNHHLMEGLKNPAGLTKNFAAVLFASNLYHPRTQKRYPITKEVLEKNNISTFIYHAQSATRFEQSFEVLTLGGFVAFYLAMLYRLNPSLIPWVDYFKAELK